MSDVSYYSGRFLYSKRPDEEVFFSPFVDKPGLQGELKK